MNENNDGREERPPELDTFDAVFAIAGEDQGNGGSSGDACFAKTIFGQS
jgi:hypothetical protein